jgi:hypothetical protein
MSETRKLPGNTRNDPESTEQSLRANKRSWPRPKASAPSLWRGPTSFFLEGNRKGHSQNLSFRVPGSYRGRKETRKDSGGMEQPYCQCNRALVVKGSHGSA